MLILDVVTYPATTRGLAHLVIFGIFYYRKWGKNLWGFPIPKICLTLNLFARLIYHNNNESPHPIFRIISLFFFSGDIPKKVTHITTHMKNTMVKVQLQNYPVGTIIRVLQMANMPFRFIFFQSTCLSSI